MPPKGRKPKTTAPTENVDDAEAVTVAVASDEPIAEAVESNDAVEPQDPGNAKKQRKPRVALNKRQSVGLKPTKKSGRIAKNVAAAEAAGESSEEAPVQAKKRGRKAANSKAAAAEPTKSRRGKKAVEVVAEDQPETDDNGTEAAAVETPSGRRTPKRRETVTPTVNQTADGDGEIVENPSEAVSGDEESEQPVASKATGRGRKVVTPAKQETPGKTTTAGQRGRPKTTASKVGNSSDDQQDGEEQAKATVERGRNARGQKKATVAPVVPEVETEDVATEEIPTDEEASPTVDNNVEEATASTAKKGRAPRKAPVQKQSKKAQNAAIKRNGKESTEDVDEAAPEEVPEAAPEAPKPGRGRKRKDDVPIESTAKVSRKKK